MYCNDHAIKQSYQPHLRFNLTAKLISSTKCETSKIQNAQTIPFSAWLGFSLLNKADFATKSPTNTTTEQAEGAEATYGK